MYRYVALLILCWSILLSADRAEAKCGSKSSESKIALLIGNSAYDDLNWPMLANAVNDIDHVCGAFEKAGFQIIDVRNATIAEMNSAADLFEVKAAESDSAIVYYAGHGFEYSGRNFMVPIDAPIFASKGELDVRFLPLEKLLSAASKAKKFNLFFMDACRTADPVVQLRDANADDPEGNVSPMGLLEMKQGAVFYSTAKGRPALDAAPIDSKISPFADAIAERLEIPGLELSDYFKVVSRDVYKNTRSLNLGPQQPFHYGSWFEDFYLNDPVTVSEQQVRKIIKNGIISKGGKKKNAVKSVQKIGSAYRFISPAIVASLKGLSIDRLAIEDEPIIVADMLEKHSVADLTVSASTGNPVAQYLLGYMYHFGVGVKEDHNVAFQWLKKSAAQGHPAGLTELAYFLQQNEPEKRQEALSLYEQAALKGFSKAKSHLGFALWTGSLGATDSERAIRLFREASNEGHPYATFAWGIYGKQELEARKRLQSLADEENLEGNNWLCELDYISHNSSGLAKNCTLAARGGYYGAQAIVADLHQRGFGLKKSQDEAIFWGKLALQNPELKTRKSLYAKIRKILAQ